MKALLRKIRIILRNKRTRRLITRTIGGFAAVIIFITTYALILPAITMEAEADCGIEAHQHDDSCYEEVLICTLPESGGHHHTKTCYNDSSVLVCGLEETEGHTHDSSCYEKVLVCDKEVHTHSAACYRHESEAFIDDAVAAGPAAGSTVSTATEDASYNAAGEESSDSAGDESFDSTEAGASNSSNSSAESGYGNENSSFAEGTAGDSASDNNSSDPEAEGSSADSEAETSNENYTNSADASNAASNATSTSSASSNSASGSLPRDSYGPTLDLLNFGTILTDRTGIYYYAPSDGEVIENSSTITDWKKTEEDTELGRNDILRVYLAYTIPAGALNETNETARYRLPANLHLTDDQVKAINESENGIAGQYINYDTLEITDPDQYHKYLGAEAVEGTRTPSDDLAEYLEKHADQHGGQEYISAVVKVEDAYDDQGNYLGQDLIFTFTPYSVQKNQHEYDSTGQPTKAGRKISGWFTLDFNMEQVDWSEPEVSTYELTAEEAYDLPAEKAESTDEDIDKADTADSTETAENAKNTDGANNQMKVTTVERSEQNADVVFVSEGTDAQNNPIHEIHTELTRVEETRTETIAENASPDEEAGKAEETEKTGEETKDTSEEAQDGMDQADAAADETTETAKPIAENSEELLNEKREDSSPVYKDGTLTSEGAGYKITLDYKADAQIPENAYLKVSEITHESDAEAYEACLKEAEKTIPTDNKTTVDEKASRFFDIEILVDEKSMEESEIPEAFADAETTETITRKIEPAAPVSVNIQLFDTEISENVGGYDAEQYKVVHFAEEGTEEIKDITAQTIEKDQKKGRSMRSNTNVDTSAIAPPTEVQFESKSFSVYGVIYTVDFQYEVNGKMYEFSIPGGGFVSLEHVVEVLGIASADENSTAYEEAIKLNEVEVSEATKKFVADVESVEFSSPVLVWIGKVNETTTVGGLKEANGLEVEFSANLTEEQIAEINAQTVEAGDWALISVQPFTSEENLTVTMKNGDQFVVKVTDAQIFGGIDGIADGGKYLIYYNSGSGSNQIYYVLRNDGYIYSTNRSADLDALGDEYLWTFDMFDRANEPYALIHNGSTYITLEGSSSGIFSNLPIPTYLTAINDSFGGYRLFGKEWVPTFFIFGYFQNHYLTFSGSAYTRADNENGNTRIKLWEQDTRKYHFTVKTEYNNIFRGTVSGRDEGNVQRDNVASYVGITSNNKTNQNSIIAVPGEGYRFKEWRLGDTVLDGYGETIATGTLTFPDDNMVLTAVFEKDPEKPDVGVADYSQMIENWKNENMNQPVDLDKTAQVYDYDNRIYEIGLDVSAKAKDIEDDVEMAFVTDVSRSMYTPAELEEVATYTSKDDLINKLNRLEANGPYGADGDHVYYIMANEKTTALVFAVRKNGNSSQYKFWKWIDCSYDDWTYNDKRGTIHNPAGANTSGYGVDKTWDDGNNGAGYLYQRVYTNNGELKLVGDTLTLNGKIYIAKDVRYRLDYLKQAVDIVSDVLYTVNPSAKVGLVTFAKEATEETQLVGKEDYGQLINALNSISVAPETNQQAGLNKAQDLWATASDPNHQRAVILITDGAPNAAGVDWSTIAGAASNLKDQKGAIVHTVGLSVSNVTGAPAGLAATAAAGGGGQTMMPNSGTELVDSVLKIIATYLKDCNYKGTLHDDIDPAFYPVKADGTPITPGFYDANGNPLTGEQIQIYNEAGTEYYLWKFNNDSSWSITWYNLEFGRGTTESPTTHKNIYVKAREDFMGGNKINTNVDSAHAIASKAVFKNEQGQTTKERFLEVIKDDMAETPYVNVDELHLTQHETEWTVYLGSDIIPENQLLALWDNIKVKQVVKKDGTIQSTETNPEDVTQISSKDKMYYEHSTSVNQDDISSPTQNENDVAQACSKLPLSHYGLDSYHAALLSAIKSGNTYDSGDIAYTAYGHDAGYFRITAEKGIDANAKDASDKAPGQHTTDVAGTAVETYKITITYEPYTTDAAETYNHTTTGGKAGKVTNSNHVEDKVKSENTHRINVIKKGFAIQKYDDNGNLIDDKPATFKLYRPSQTGETGKNVEGLGSGFIEVATLTTSSGSASLADAFQELRKLPTDQHYYLVETKEPDGYEKLTSPIQIDVSVNDGEQTSPYWQTENITDLINVGTPTATIFVSSTSAEVLTDSEGIFVLKVINKSATVDIEILKVDEKGEPLDLATFRLQKLEGSYQDIKAIKVSSGSEDLKYPAIGGLDENSSFVSGSEKVIITKLPDGSYKLVEDSTHDGYIIKQKEIEFTISGGVVSGTDIDGIVNFEEADGITLALITVTNEPGAALPSTGGSGTNIVYLFGIMLTGFAGVGLVMRRRRKAA